jgi:hypothetical protein
MSYTRHSGGVWGASRRYQLLRNVSLAHRILQPFAQEELLRVVDIKSNKSLGMLLEVLRGSDRLAFYAKGTKEIRLCDLGNTREDAMLNRLSEFCPNVDQILVCEMDINLSGISESPALLALCLNPTHSQYFLACFGELRHLILFTCDVYIDPPPTAFPYLETLNLCHVEWRDLNANNAINSRELHSVFSPAQLPALINLVLDSDAINQDGPLYNDLVPQLTHLEFYDVPLHSILDQLQLCTALKLLRIMADYFSAKDLSEDFIKSFKALNLEEFHFHNTEVNTDDDVWQQTFPAIQKLLEVLEDVESLKTL